MWLALLLLLALVSATSAGQVRSQNLDREFQAAATQYEAGHYSDAVVILEKILRQVPENFEVHELLGLAYSGQSDDAKANPHLEKAVRLKRGSASARTNLAANLARFKVPREVLFVEALPRNATGKVLKRELTSD